MVKSPASRHEGGEFAFRAPLARVPADHPEDKPGYGNENRCERDDLLMRDITFLTSRASWRSSASLSLCPLQLSAGRPTGG